MFRLTFLLVALLLTVQDSFSQSYAFGLKGGLTAGFQKWDGIDQDPLFKYHGALFIESAPENNEFAVFAQAGYHIKGSAIRNRNFLNPLTGNFSRPPAQEFLFHNISLILGGKQKHSIGSGNTSLYYMIGVRGDYTMDTNLEEYEDFNLRNPSYSIYPFEAFVNKFNYGVSAGGGIELPFSELIGMVLEFSVHPDFSRQYLQPPIQNVRDPYTGQNRTIDERVIRNTTFEISLGFRFLNKVEYID